MYLNYNANTIHNFLKQNKFKLFKKFKFPFFAMEDRIYKKVWKLPKSLKLNDNCKYIIIFFNI